jgi:hypothetical protein
MKCCKNKVERIIEGWENYVFKTPEIEKIALHRAEICAVCSQNKNEWCVQCKCFIPAKTRSKTEKCPCELW